MVKRDVSHYADKFNDKTSFQEMDSIMNDDFLFASSCYDCTGLIPSGGHGEEEAQNYNEVYPYLPSTPGNAGREAEGIHVEMRKEVTDQHPHTHLK